MEQSKIIDTLETYQQSTTAVVVGVKTGRSRVGGPELCVWGSMVTRDDGDTMFTQVWALLKEVKPYIMLDCIR